MIIKIKNSLLFKSTFIYTLTEVIKKAIPFLLLPILTMYLSPLDYGIVSTYGAFTSILAVFIHLSLVGAINVNYFKYTKENLKIYIANTLLIVFLSSVLLTFFLFIFQDDISLRLKIPSIWLFIGLFSIIAQFFTILNLGLWQVEQNPKAYGIYQILFVITNTFIVLVLVVWLNFGWKGQLIGQFSTNIFFALLSFIFIYKRRYIQFSLNTIYIKDALKFGLPLIPHALSGWFKTGVDRFFLTTLISVSATGIYSIGYQLGMIVGIIAAAFNQAYSPYLYRKLSDIKDSEKVVLVKFTYLYFIVILFFAILISFLMPLMVEVFLDKRYLAAKEFIPWIAFGYAFQGMYFMVVNYIFYEKKTYILAFVSFISGIIHVLFSYAFIKQFGTIGAAYATTLSFFIMFIMVWILSARIYKMPWCLK